MFLINVPVAVAVVAIGVLHVPESRGEEREGRFDLPGAALGVVGLGGITIALIQGGWLPAAIGVAGAVAFLVVEAGCGTPCCRSGCSPTRRSPPSSS